MKKIALHWKILIAMVFGILWSLLSGAFGLNDFTKDWIDPFGTIFINCLKFIAVPLVLFSIIGFAFTRFRLFCQTCVIGIPFCHCRIIVCL